MSRATVIELGLWGAFFVSIITGDMHVILQFGVGALVISALKKG